MRDLTQMRTWAEVDLDALAHNYRLLRNMAGPDCRFLGLVKADAYGHGAVRVGQKLQELGADMLAVACVAEAVELRQGGVTLPILCLGQTPPELAEILLQQDITQTVEDLETGRALSQAAQAAGRRLKIHVKLDTGMSRLGFLWPSSQAEQQAVVETIETLCALPGLEAEGLFTHFADADGSQSYTATQLARFLEAKQALEKRGVGFTIYHCGASAAVLNYPYTHMNMIRPGIALYGYAPVEEPEVQGKFQAVMRVKSRISAVRAVPAGTPVSYGRTAVLKRDSRLAVVPIGYGDGYPRGLSNRTQVEIHGTYCPVVGRICMDMCMVDVTDLPQVQAGDVAEIYTPELITRAAKLTDTIVYELLCGVSPRVPRIYVEQEKKDGQ
jgi:alanine racemase